MNRKFIDGAIVCEGSFFEPCLFDVGNKLLTAQFDGKLNVSKYAVMNKYEILEKYFSVLCIDDVPLSYGESKTVSMLGRIQSLNFSTEKADFEVELFVADKENAVLIETTVTAKEDISVKNVVNFGLNFTSYLKEMFNSRMSMKTLLSAARVVKDKVREEKDGDIGVIRNDPSGDFYFDVASDASLTAMEKSSRYCTQFSISAQLKKGESKALRLAISGGTRKDFSYTDVKDCIKNFSSLKASAYDFVSQIAYPDEKGSPLEKAFYSSCLSCALSNYKELGNFKGFLAGIVYQFPARTYFRDGYWTILSVLKTNPSLVKNEIITLAHGIGKHGECASAVKSTFKNYWGDHYDSPSFFVMMLYDYVVHTRDFSILENKVKGKTVLSLARLALDRLIEKADDTGLLVKEGEYNRRDWCDNVFRTGYVTYDEALFARALFAMSELLSISRPEEGKLYKERHEKVKAAINDLLWSDEKGYFVNFRTTEGDVEDNLSIDTVLVPLFGLTTLFRANSVLEEMESLLESKNNLSQVAGDFGVFCVYPFYKNGDSVVQKSSLPYYYHNGGEWPYFSCIYAYTKLAYGMDCSYPLFRWFEYNVEQGNYTPVEFFSPLHADGSLLQAWSSTGAFVLSYPNGDFFTKTL